MTVSISQWELNELNNSFSKLGNVRYGLYNIRNQWWIDQTTKKIELENYIKQEGNIVGLPIQTVTVDRVYFEALQIF